MGLDKVCYNIIWKYLRCNDFGCILRSDRHTFRKKRLYCIKAFFAYFKEKRLVKRFVLPLVLVLVIAVCLPIASMSIIAKGENTADAAEFDPDNTFVTYGYLEKFKEELRREIIEELMQEGGISISSEYKDISLKEGEILILSPESEVIYRGGNAVAITSTDKKGDGITDMSTSHELFSGEALEYGHIYYASSSESRRAILVVGSTAYFTVRGSYEIG